MFAGNSDQSTNLSGDASSLCHSAAKHKMAIKPKRKHGAPHKKRQVCDKIETGFLYLFCKRFIF